MIFFCLCDFFVVVFVYVVVFVVFSIVVMFYEFYGEFFIVV